MYCKMLAPGGTAKVTVLLATGSCKGLACGTPVWTETGTGTGTLANGAQAVPAWTGIVLAGLVGAGAMGIALTLQLLAMAD
eukprot:CAMPEP_0180488732 /NCGR_PEP_ID=MMETSP1036_2-20121128/38211_1 /TAXON_ID=632150 /ORGANISM="Azadinium spinosum, Strain 3D9" /LENGTH=80 /DNA_ID=CAMNT_0022496823 /DNA_START=524 /DNA_END=763 /DNA_ORIENTATION=-